jgi:hypothetical protein
MRFMNDYDIARAQARHGEHPVLGPALETLGNLVVWTNCNSDGWAYWPKPCRAAARAIELIESTTTTANELRQRHDASDAEVKAALQPIKAFLTRQGVRPESVLPARQTAVAW